MIDFKKLLAQTQAAAVPNSIPAPQPEKDLVVSAPVTTTDGALGGNGSPVEAGAVVEYPGLVDLRERIYALDKALLAKHPAMDSLLQTIHRNLQKDPELIHLLKPEERAMIFAGLKNKTQTVIVQETVKSAGSGKNKGLKNIGLEDM